MLGQARHKVTAAAEVLEQASVAVAEAEAELARTMDVLATAQRASTSSRCPSRNQLY